MHQISSKWMCCIYIWGWMCYYWTTNGEYIQTDFVSHNLSRRVPNHRLSMQSQIAIIPHRFFSLRISINIRIIHQLDYNLHPFDIILHFSHDLICVQWKIVHRVEKCVCISDPSILLSHLAYIPQNSNYFRIRFISHKIFCSFAIFYEWIHPIRFNYNFRCLPITFLQAILSSRL